MRLTIALAVSLLVTTPASAKVVSADAHTLSIEHNIGVAAPPMATWNALTRVSQWWSKDHTYSGIASNLTLDPRPGGCFCERLPKNGGIEHMRVTMVQPGEHMVLTGALGPLLYEGANGILDIEIKREGGGSRLIMRYKAYGFASGNAAKLAPVVDMVLGQQAQSLARLAAGPR